MSTRRSFTVTLKSHELSPDKVAIGDLAELLRALQRAFQGVASDRDRSANATSDLIVSLVAIEGGSANLAFAINNELEGGNRLQDLVSAINSPSARPENRNVIAPLVTVARKLNTRIELKPEDSSIPSGEIFPDEEIDGERLVWGQTTVYGTLERIGGTQPKARIRLDDGSAITIGISHSMAQELAPKLYREIGIAGTVGWDITDWSIKVFNIEDVLDYESSSLEHAFQELAEACGPTSWRINDVVGAIAILREEDKRQGEDEPW